MCLSLFFRSQQCGFLGSHPKVCCPQTGRKEGGAEAKKKGKGEEEEVIEEEVKEDKVVEEKMEEDVEEGVTISSTGLRGAFDEKARSGVTKEDKEEKEEGTEGFSRDGDEFPVYGGWHPVSEEFP